MTPDKREKITKGHSNYLVCLQTQVLYDAAVQYEVSSDWVQAAEMWKACVNETMRQTEECRIQCEVASQALPEDRGVDSVDGVFEKAAGKNKRNFLLFLFAEFT